MSTSRATQLQDVSRSPKEGCGIVTSCFLSTLRRLWYRSFFFFYEFYRSRMTIFLQKIVFKLEIKFSSPLHAFHWKRRPFYLFSLQVGAKLVIHPLSSEKVGKAGNRFSLLIYLIYGVKCLWTVKLFDQCVSD